MHVIHFLRISSIMSLKLHAQIIKLFANFLKLCKFRIFISVGEITISCYKTRDFVWMLYLFDQWYDEAPATVSVVGIGAHARSTLACVSLLEPQITTTASRALLWPLVLPPLSTDADGRPESHRRTPRGQLPRSCSR